MAEHPTPESSALVTRSHRDGALEAALERLEGGRVSAERRQVSASGSTETCPRVRPDTPDLQVTAVRRLPAAAAQYAPFPAALDPRLVNALQARGISQLYTHQADAIEHALARRNVVVITPTASGKTLCYNAPVLHS